MSVLTESAAWKALESHRLALEGVHMRDLFASNSDRFGNFSVRFEDILLDYSKNIATEETISLLLALATQANVQGWARKTFAGE